MEGGGGIARSSNVGEDRRVYKGEREPARAEERGRGYRRSEVRGVSHRMEVGSRRRRGAGGRMEGNGRARRSKRR